MTEAHYIISVYTQPYIHQTNRKVSQILLGLKKKKQESFIIQHINKLTYYIFRNDSYMTKERTNHNRVSTFWKEYRKGSRAQKRK